MVAHCNGLQVDYESNMKHILLLCAACAALNSSCTPNLGMEPTITRTTREPVMNVILVHGFLQSGYSYKAMRKRLEKHNIRCLTARLSPSDGRTGICTLASDLKEQIDEAFGHEQKFSMVGYSMGGLVSRYYLQKLGGAERCQQLITIASPHQGTVMANLYPSKGARQMRRGSEFLRELADSEDALGDIPVVSYRTPLDLMILPSTSSIWERAENKAHTVAMHPLMLKDSRVLDDVERRLLSQLQ